MNFGSVRAWLATHAPTCRDRHRHQRHLDRCNTLGGEIDPSGVEPDTSEQRGVWPHSISSLGSAMPLDNIDRRPSRQARSERVADPIIAAGLAGLLAAGVNWRM